jgi:hypothetical protein
MVAGTMTEIIVVGRMMEMELSRDKPKLQILVDDARTKLTLHSRNGFCVQQAVRS